MAEGQDGRGKTLRHRIQSGSLVDRGNPEHVQARRELDIDGFDRVVVNLYQFSETLAAMKADGEVSGAILVMVEGPDETPANPATRTDAG